MYQAVISAEKESPLYPIKPQILFSIKQRCRIFQIIENEVAHFTEIEAGAAMICLPSLAELLDGKARKNQSLKRN